MRLVDADELIDILANMLPWAITSPEDNAMVEGLSRAYEVINSVPIIDAAPIVRCKDCIHRDTTYEWHGDYNCRLHHNPKSLDFFCADGKRREEGNT